MSEKNALGVIIGAEFPFFHFVLEGSCKGMVSEITLVSTCSSLFPVGSVYILLLGSPVYLSLMSH